MVWSQLELEKPHIAYACVGIFSTIFSLVSLFVKEKLYMGEATVATIAGLILGPHCLGWFDPVTWGNTDFITLEICRIVLCIQIVAVAVELPRKYMKKHWVSVAILLVPVMTCGWLIVGLFIWILIPHFNFSSALLVSACVTATDPVLAAAVVGKGKFAQRVPGHLRNLLTAESGCNDGMAFPFIFLSLNLIIYGSNAREIVKDWFTLTILWECFFGCFLGAILGLSLRHLLSFAERSNLIDRESFLAIFIFLAFNSAGIGSMLGVDDLLVSFAAGTAFGWNGDFARKTDESHVSTVIDLLLNLAFFVYFGAIVPWPDFNNAEIGLNAWRLIILGLVIIFLRRIPAVLVLKPFTPDIKTWREALFCGHFGPIGVGAIFAAILARKDLESHYTSEETPLRHLPSKDSPHYQLIATIWPMVCFIVITSIIVHGSSVAVLTLGRRLNRMAITMSFTTTNTQEQGNSWINRLQKLDKTATSFSLHRINTKVIPTSEEESTSTGGVSRVETSGVKVRPAGGARRKKHKKKRMGPGDRLKKTLSRATTYDTEGYNQNGERQRPEAQVLQLDRTPSTAPTENYANDDVDTDESLTSAQIVEKNIKLQTTSPYSESPDSGVTKNSDASSPDKEDKDGEGIPVTAYAEGKSIILEDKNGEIVSQYPIKNMPEAKGNTEELSIRSMESLNRRMSQYSEVMEDSKSMDSGKSGTSASSGLRTVASLKNSVGAYGDRMHKKVYSSKKDSSRKVYAYQVDDFIVIENSEGEIIRRYKVNRHSKPEKISEQRQRSGSIVDRALSFVQGRSRRNTTSRPAPETAPNSNTEPATSSKISGSGTAERQSSDKKLEKKLSNILGRVTKRSPSPKAAIAPTSVHNNTIDEEVASSEEESASSQEESASEADEDSNQYSEADSEGGETDSLEETQIERIRRLAALGHMPTKRNDDDEED